MTRAPQRSAPTVKNAPTVNPHGKKTPWRCGRAGRYDLQVARMSLRFPRPSLFLPHRALWPAEGDTADHPTTSYHGTYGHRRAAPHAHNSRWECVDFLSVHCVMVSDPQLLQVAQCQRITKETSFGSKNWQCSQRKRTSDHHICQCKL